MERIQILNIPLRVARFAGERLLGGGWDGLPPLPQGEIVRPIRASAARHAAELTIPENIQLGEE